MKERTATGRHHRLWRWARPAGGALVLGVLVARLGTGPFVDGVRRVDLRSVLVVLALTAMTTLLSSWRWQLVARSLGLRLPLRRAVASYYRSQLLNSVLPGGVLGDVHRGLRQGADAHDMARGLRSVAWDRAVGQVVQLALAAVALLALSSPVRSVMAVVVGVGLVAAVAAVLLVLAVPALGASWPARAARTTRHDVRRVLLDRSTGPAVLALSAVVVLGHVTVFLVAARAAGTSASLARLLPLGVLVLLAMSVPTSIGGWGPREGVAAWAFAAAGLGAGQGLSAATTYGVLSLVAVLPGAVVLVLSWWSRRTARRAPQRPLGPPPRPSAELVGTAAGVGAGAGFGQGSDG